MTKPRPASAPTTPPYGNLKVVAAQYGFKYSSLRYAVANGLSHLRIGRAIYVKYEDLDQWLAGQMEHHDR